MANYTIANFREKCHLLALPFYKKMDRTIVNNIIALAQIRVLILRLLKGPSFTLTIDLKL
jgi:hypothetical protein